MSRMDFRSSVAKHMKITMRKPQSSFPLPHTFVRQITTLFLSFEKYLFQWCVCETFTFRLFI